MKRHPVAVIIGTRPEAIKLAPVVRALANSRLLKPVTISTSQHREMVRQIFLNFGVKEDFDLNVMRKSQTLWDLSSRLSKTLGDFFIHNPMKAALVQGDTTSAFFGSLCAYYHQIPVGHVEAGLRSGNRYSPFPEEINRSLIGRVATWHFAPTQDAAKRLRMENIPSKDIFFTGNTVVDALHWMIKSSRDAPVKRLVGKLKQNQKLLLVTCHRRENLGKPMISVARALVSIAKAHPEIVILFPVHPNPAVRKVMLPLLNSIANIRLCEPLNYDDFLSCLKHAYLVLSDSGGVQEESTALGKPVLVLRRETERPEGVKAGTLKLVGTDTEKIIREANLLLNSQSAYQRMTRGSKVFGDGHAAEKIVRVLEKNLSSATI